MRRYLLVDDNLELAENLAEILRDRGDEVDIASNGQAALDLLRGRRFDALVTDMKMPAMGGAHLVHALRAIDPLLPAIVLTAFSESDDLEIARREGLLAVLSKPVPLPRLFELLDRARRGGAVALVEDDSSLSENLAEVLRSRGFTAVTASSLLEAERFGEVQPFAALVDLRVPGGVFGEVMERLDRRFPGLPQIVITAYADRPLPRLAHAVFAKPFDTDELIEKLEALYLSRP